MHDQKYKDNDPQKIFGRIHVISWFELKESPGKLKNKTKQTPNHQQTPPWLKNIKEKRNPHTGITMTKWTFLSHSSLKKLLEEAPQTTVHVHHWPLMDNTIQENAHVTPRMNESLIHGLHTRGSKFLFCSLNWRYIWNTTILLRRGRLLRKLSRSRACRTNHCKGKKHKAHVDKEEYHFYTILKCFGTMRR